jgi:hypothetical protein
VDRHVRTAGRTAFGHTTIRAGWASTPGGRSITGVALFAYAFVKAVRVCLDVPAHLRIGRCQHHGRRR